MSTRLYTVLILLGALAGCNAIKTAQVPSGTTASYNLRSEIVRAIDAKQKIFQPECGGYDITNAQVAGSKDQTILEEWRVLACGQVVVYDVQIIRTPYGGTTYNVTRRE